MREGWSFPLLSEITDEVRGSAVPDSSTDYELWSVPSFADGRPEVVKGEVIRSSKRPVQAGDVLLCKINPRINRVWIVGDKQDLPKVASTEWIVLRPKSTTVLSARWLQPYLSTPEFRDWIVGEISGATGSHTRAKPKEVMRWRIPVPPFSEQKRIVAILDEAFAGIATAVANTERNLANARELFESYLNAVFSQRGDGWNSRMLKEVGRLQTGSTPKASEQGNYGNYIPFIKPGDFRPDGTVNYSNEGLSPEGAKKARTVQANSVLMVCIGATIGKTGFVEKAVTTNQQINAFVPHDGCCYKFAYYQMLSTGFQRQVLARAGQATLPIISKAKWSELPLWFPINRAEQNQIVAKLDELASAKREVQSVYERKLVALAELKHSLLQKAFSGELTSVPQDEIEIALA